MSPSNYIKSRDLSQKQPQHASNIYFATLVDGRPYLPNLRVDATNDQSVCRAALATVVISAYVSIISSPSSSAAFVANVTESTNNDDTAADSTTKNDNGESNDDGQLTILNLQKVDWEALISQSLTRLTCTKVTGGITNALVRVSGFRDLIPSIKSAVDALLSEHNCNDTTHTSTTSTDIASIIDYNSLLLRIFGAEGMIDRDVETSTYAALCNVSIAYRYLGRFQNGRIEGWLEGFRPLTVEDLQEEPTSLEIAREMARLHCLFEVPEGELREHHCGKRASADGEENGEAQAGLWDQLTSWMEQAKGYTEFRTPGDTERVKSLQLHDIERELRQILERFSVTRPQTPMGTSQHSTAANASTTSSQGGKIVFCHNDLLAANIMRHPETNRIQLIDFEYGGTNYAAFDMANHFNEHAGGTSAKENGQTDYSKFPDLERQKKFCVEYVKMMRRLQSNGDLSGSNVEGKGLGNADKAEGIIPVEEVHEEAMDLLDQVHQFILVNHLYWGLWAINQAAEEGCEDFDYIRYATNRFQEYYARKKDWEAKA
mmetsp:Transcript_13669/g.26717  ORF Transcript_13669/g.26717 Transcript_13669/m.26717 type:complete len:545 (+) Transcript_13669:93-1727(+)